MDFKGHGACEYVTITAYFCDNKWEMHSACCKQGGYMRVITVQITPERSALASEHADQLLFLKINMQSTTIFIVIENFSFH